MSTGTGWSYAEALAWLEAHVNLEAVVAGRPEPSLDRMRRLCALMGDPQAAFPVVHLTGTNGKGSTARMITALLAGRGLTVGTYTSPDLEGVNERIALTQGHIDAPAAGSGRAGPVPAPSMEPIADDDLAAVLEAVAALEGLLDSQLTRFEILTAAAFRWFADVAVDAAVVEVGLGGLYDATNVADGQVAVVTNVSLDHTDVLGPELAGIAAEKAGIVKPGSVLVLGETSDALAAVFRRAGAGRTVEIDRHFGVRADRAAVGGRLVSLRTSTGEYDDVYLPVHGAHQATNAALAVAAAEAFFGGPLPDDVVSEAFGGLRLPGRMEVMGRHPLVLLDGAHNVAGAKAAAATVAEEFAGDGGLIAVVGMLQGRDAAEMLVALGLETARLIVACPAPSPRSQPAAAIAAAARSLGVAAVEAASVPGAVEAALAEAGEDDRVLITGSLYVVGAARTVLRSRDGDVRSAPADL
ncbi:MAG TPA: Mur ligase family protein [Acidimicrobiales bacterium]|nr:Mur ligase family protein [Acidimicrobiales bacterium]